RMGEVRNDIDARESRRKKDGLPQRLEFELRCALRSIKSRRSRRGGIGRRAGLKIQWPQGRVGSSPSAGKPPFFIGKRSHGRIVPNHSSFRKRNRFGVSHLRRR